MKKRLLEIITKLIEKLKKITWDNIKGFIQGYFRLFKRNYLKIPLAIHLQEQIIWRRMVSNECMQLGNCKHCGCEMIGKTMEDRGCSNSPACYPDMMGKEDWEMYKKINNIKLFL